MKPCWLIAVLLVVGMASCAVAKDAILFLNAHPDDTDGFAGTAYLLKDKYEVDGSVAAGYRSASELAKLLLEVRPRAVFTHWLINNHADHAQCSAILANALRKSGLKPELPCGGLY